MQSLGLFNSKEVDRVAKVLLKVPLSWAQHPLRAGITRPFFEEARLGPRQRVKCEMEV